MLLRACAAERGQDREPAAWGISWLFLMCQPTMERATNAGKNVDAIEFATHHSPISERTTKLKLPSWNASWYAQ
jgi:hypothetical protein